MVSICIYDGEQNQGKPSTLEVRTDKQCGGLHRRGKTDEYSHLLSTIVVKEQAFPESVRIDERLKNPLFSCFQLWYNNSSEENVRIEIK